MSTTSDRDDPGLKEVLPNGQNAKYLVLSEEERQKGFIRPVHRTYRHTLCSTETTMGEALSETYARQPTFYGATFCAHCKAHFPVGEDGEFFWKVSGGDGPKVGT